MKSLFVVLFSLISLTVVANDTKESPTILSITDDLIETVNSSSIQVSNMSYFNDGPCYYRTGTITCKSPCSGGSSFSTGCHESDEEAGVTMGQLSAQICSGCGAVIDFEVGCED